jgi:hypothetical protein
MREAGMICKHDAKIDDQSKRQFFTLHASPKTLDRVESCKKLSFVLVDIIVIHARDD